MTAIKSSGTGFRYTTMLYDKLDETAKLEPATALVEFGYPSDDPDDIRIFRGWVYQTGANIGLSRSSVATAMVNLNQMQCVTNLKMGGPKVESVYILNYRPTEEQYRSFNAQKSATSRKISPTRYDTLIDELIRVKAQLKALDLRVKILEGNDGR